MVWVLSIVSVLVLLGANIAMAQYQSDRSGAQGASAQGGGSQEIRGSSGGSSMRVVPMFSISERYNSNIFNSALSKMSDYITDIRPGARVNYQDDSMEGSFVGSALSGIYAQNPGLNYVGVAAALNVSLDRMMGKFVRGLGLSIADAVTYWPEQPAFVTPESPESDFTRGIQTRRNNTLTNTTNVMGTYAMTPLAQLMTSYSLQRRRFLDEPVSVDTGLPLELFNTTIHSVSGGPMYQVLPNHSIGASYTFRYVSRVPNTGVGPGTSDIIQGAMVSWRSSLAQGLRVELSPGFSVVARQPDTLIPTIHAGVQWNDEQKSVALAFNRNIFPNFYAQAALLVSNVTSATIALNLSDRWRVSLGSSYALNTRLGGEDYQQQSVNIHGEVYYRFYPGISASLGGSHSMFRIDQPGSTIDQNRQMVTFSLTAEGS